MSWQMQVWSGVLLAAELAVPVSALAATATREQAIERAQQAKQQGVPFDNGPCLGVVLPGWEAEVAHEPR